MTDMNKDHIECVGIDCTPKKDLEAREKELAEQKTKVGQLKNELAEIRLVLDKKEDINEVQLMVRDKLKLQNDFELQKQEIEDNKKKIIMQTTEISDLRLRLKDSQKDLLEFKTKYQLDDEIQILNDNIKEKKETALKIENDIKLLKNYHLKLKETLEKDKTEHKQIIDDFNLKLEEKKKINKEIKTLKMQLGRLIKQTRKYKNKKKAMADKNLFPRFKFNLKRNGAKNE